MVEKGIERANGVQEGRFHAISERWSEYYVMHER